MSIFSEFLPVSQPEDNRVRFENTTCKSNFLLFTIFLTAHRLKTSDYKNVATLEVFTLRRQDKYDREFHVLYFPRSSLRLPLWPRSLLFPETNRRTLTSYSCRNKSNNSYVQNQSLKLFGFPIDFFIKGYTAKVFAHVKVQFSSGSPKIWSC